MTKQEYLSAIRGKIRKMPADDINKFMDYYSEMIDDRMEDGLSPRFTSPSRETGTSS